MWEHDYCLTALSLGRVVKQHCITGIECLALFLDFVLLFVGGVLRSAAYASGLTQTQTCPFILQLRFLYWTKALIIGFLLQLYESREASPYADAYETCPASSPDFFLLTLFSTPVPTSLWWIQSINFPNEARQLLVLVILNLLMTCWLPFKLKKGLCLLMREDVNG